MFSHSGFMGIEARWPAEGQPSRGGKPGGVGQFPFDLGRFASVGQLVRAALGGLRGVLCWGAVVRVCDLALLGVEAWLVGEDLKSLSCVSLLRRLRRGSSAMV